MSDNPRKQHGVYINDSELLARIVKLEAENEDCEEWGKSGARMKEQAEAERDDYKAVAIDAAKDQARLTAELSLSREQTEYANDAMMAMCKRAEGAEDELATLKAQLDAIPTVLRNEVEDRTIGEDVYLRWDGIKFVLANFDAYWPERTEA